MKDNGILLKYTYLTLSCKHHSKQQQHTDGWTEVILHALNHYNFNYLLIKTTKFWKNVKKQEKKD
jgi:hypothetical protein